MGQQSCCPPPRARTPPNTGAARHLSQGVNHTVLIFARMPGRHVVAKLADLLHWFTPSPWAPAGVSQTFFASWNPPAKHPYSRQEAVTMPDGVQVR